MSRSLMEALALACGLLFPISACTSQAGQSEIVNSEKPSASDTASPEKSPEPPVTPVIEEQPLIPADRPAEANRPVRPRQQPPAARPKAPETENAAEAGDEAADTGADLAVPAAQPDPPDDSETDDRSRSEPQPDADDGDRETAVPAVPGAIATGRLTLESTLLDLRLKNIEQQNKELLERLKKLETRVNELEDDTQHQTLGVGLGLASGLKEAKGEYRFVLEANLRYVFGCLYAQTGFCAGLAANLRLWDIQLHWLGVGIMYYGHYGKKDALSVPEFGRSWDFMLTSGVDWRVWKGLEIRAQVAWFIPTPGPIYEKAKERIEKAVDEISIANPMPDKKAPEEAWDIVVDAYTRAFRSPYLVFGVRWEF